MVTSKPNSPISQTRPSGFHDFRAEEGFEDHRAWDGSNTLLVSSRPHARPEEEDPADEGIEDEGRGDREGKRLVLQHHPTSDPDEAKVESEGEGQHPCTHDHL
jgi:hypothetical protein